MRLSWHSFCLNFWLKFLAGLSGLAVFLTLIQVVLSPYQNLILKFDGQVGDFYAEKTVADHNVTDKSTLLTTPNCLLVPVMSGTLNCVTDAGAIRWQNILTDALNSNPTYLSRHQALLLTQYGGGLLLISEETGNVIWHYKDLDEFNWKQTLVSDDQQLIALLNTRNQVFVFETNTGSLLWKTAVPQNALLEPKTKIFVYQDKVLVTDSAAFTITSMDFKTGTQIWQHRNYTGDTEAHPEFAGNLVWYQTNFSSWQGAAPETGQIKAKFSPPPGNSTTNLYTSFVSHNYGNTLFWFDTETGAAVKQTKLSGKIQKVWFDQQLFVQIAAAPFVEKLTRMDVVERTEIWTSEPLQIIKDYLVLDEKIMVVASLNGAVSWLNLETGATLKQIRTQETALTLRRQQNTPTGFWLITTHHGNFSSAKKLTDVWLFETPGILTRHYPDLPVVGATGLSHNNKLWLVNQSQNAVVAITTKPVQRDLRFWLRKTDARFKSLDLLTGAFQFFEKLSERKVPKEKTLVLKTDVSRSFQGCIISTTVSQNDPSFKKTIQKSGFNPWQESKIVAKLKRGTDTIATVRGFYFLPDLWRTIVLAPNLEQAETLALEIELTANGETLTEVTAVDVPPNCVQNFITLSPDKKSLQTPTEDFFWGMGIQDVALDGNSNGSLFDDWQYGLTAVPDFTTELASQDFGTYIKTFRQSGFSIFRISQDNFSYKNWLSFQPTSFRASLHTGLITDDFLRQLKAENYRVVFGLFGFDPETESEAITAYLDYSIARFGAWVDVWELSNEAWPEEKWVEFVSNYLRQHDPYQHPITTSWDRSNLSAIDIVNLHYYRSEPRTELTAEFLNQVLSHRAVEKPILFGEFGNSGTNWDTDSAERLRIKSWLAAWQRVPLIIWNQSGTESQAPTNANVYMGPTERKVIGNLTSWLGKYEGISLRPISVNGSTGNFCSGLTNSATLILIYCTNSSGVPRAEFFDPATIAKLAGISGENQNWKITWFDPKTLKEIAVTRLKKTATEKITTPAFYPDLVSEWQLE